MDTDSVQSGFTYMGRKFSDLGLNDDSSSAFSDCNSDRSGEFPTASSESRRLFLACASDNSDEVIAQLVSALESNNIDDQKQAAMEIRLLAKNKPDNRIKIARAGAIKPLISIISSNDPQLQEYGVTAILNLSLCARTRKKSPTQGRSNRWSARSESAPQLPERTPRARCSDCPKLTRTKSRSGDPARFRRWSICWRTGISGARKTRARRCTRCAPSRRTR
ncbi:UNVERIFIED_CONTAM: U-box domain-containing protein 15 [Sesamum latifolium]|uniref:U-box domain-containing protein 15 n=1 Tax=Sesamum latifolium TaxID=2727402 RepID=A0AAW2VS77_9LAMI